jgi:hypothetical protein
MTPVLHTMLIAQSFIQSHINSANICCTVSLCTCVRDTMKNKQSPWPHSWAYGQSQDAAFAEVQHVKMIKVPWGFLLDLMRCQRLGAEVTALQPVHPMAPGAESFLPTIPSRNPPRTLDTCSKWTLTLLATESRRLFIVADLNPYLCTYQ